MSTKRAPSFAVITDANAYWNVAGKIYSTRARAYVEDSDDKYAAWKSSGRAPLEVTSEELKAALKEAKLPPYKPVTALQARRALRAAGLYDAVVAAVNAATDADLKDSWEYATEWLRDAPWISSMAAQLNLSSDQVDALFVQASAL